MADLGKVGITYDKNGYVATTQYEPLTVLKYTDGGTYMSILPTLGHLPTDTNYWVTVVPPITASEIGYTPIAGGVITNTNIQGAIEQADSLKVSTNKIANNLTTGDAGYVLDARQGKVLNESLTYSVTPVTVGKWINGESIKRVVYHMTELNQSGTFSIDLTSLNVEKVINASGHMIRTNGIEIPLEHSDYDSTYETGWYFQSKIFYIRMGSSVTISSYYAVIEYI